MFTPVNSKVNANVQLFEYNNLELDQVLNEVKDDPDYSNVLNQFEKQHSVKVSKTVEKIINFVRIASKVGSVLGLGLLVVGIGSFLFGGLPIFFIPAIVAGATLLVVGVACTVFLFFSKFGIHSNEAVTAKLCSKILEDERLKGVAIKDIVIEVPESDCQVDMSKYEERINTNGELTAKDQERIKKEQRLNEMVSESKYESEREELKMCVIIDKLFPELSLTDEDTEAVVVEGSDAESVLVEDTDADGNVLVANPDELSEDDIESDEV